MTTLYPDLEMNEMEAITEESPQPEQEELLANHNNAVVIDVEVEEEEKHKKAVFKGLSKAELLAVEERETYWRKIRIGLFVAFWLIWLGMLVASIVIIVLTPKCPSQPYLQFWEKTCMYRLDPHAFKDNNNDGVGDIKGLASKVEYITQEMNADTIILDGLAPGSFGDTFLHLTTSFEGVDKVLGTRNEFIQLVKRLKKNGTQIVPTLDMSSVSVDHPWVKDKPKFLAKLQKEGRARNGFSNKCILDSVEYFTSMGVDRNGSCQSVNLDLGNSDVVDELKKIVKKWLQEVGVGGILFTNVAHFFEDVPNATDYVDANVTVKSNINFLTAIRTVFDDVNSAATKKKLFMIEFGDIQEGVDSSTSLQVTQYLDPHNDSSKPLADVVLTPHFYYRQGWKNKQPTYPAYYYQNQLEVFPKLVKMHKRRIATATASPYHLRHGSLEAIVGNLLLPSLCVVHMGSELNITLDVSTRVSQDNLNSPYAFPFYPRNSRSLAYLGSDGNNFDKDIFQHALMPWNTGVNDSQEYDDMFRNSDNTYQIMSAVGAPVNTFTLFKNLTNLRKTKPAIQWGHFKWIQSPVVDENSGYKKLIFLREAVGYGKFIVIFIRSNSTINNMNKNATKLPQYRQLPQGEVVSLKHVCEQGRVRFTYPRNEHLPVTPLDEKPVSLENVFVSTNNNWESLTLLECAE